MTEDFKRYDNLFSLCGLNCGLCPMQIRGECPGCFKESFCAKQCPIVPCSVRHGNIQYCFECDEYPCAKYDSIDQFDSLISHKNQKSDMAKAKRIGIENYFAGQMEKQLILNRLLTEYDDGHREVIMKQITLSDRIVIEAGICTGKSIKKISEDIGKNPSTVSREIRTNRSYMGNSADILRKDSEIDDVRKAVGSVDFCFMKCRHMSTSSLFCVNICAKLSYVIYMMNKSFSSEFCQQFKSFSIELC